MYCTDCGTVNPEGSLVCVKCGRNFSAPTEEPKTLAEWTLPTTPYIKEKYWGPTSPVSKPLIYAMAGIAAAMIPLLIIMWQMNTAPQSGGKLSDLKETIESFQGGASQGGMPGEEVVPPEEKKIDPGKLLDAAGDMQRRANGRRLQMIIETFHAENDRYPATLAEIPPDMVDFKLVPEIYQYRLDEKTGKYLIKVVIEGNAMADEVTIEEDGVTKLLLRGY